MRTDFSQFGYTSPPYNLTLGCYPLEMEQIPEYDELFISRRPTIFVSAGCVIVIRSARSGYGRYCACTVRDRYTRRELYHGNIPLHPQFV
jgi:hypothetical protein